MCANTIAHQPNPQPTPLSVHRSGSRRRPRGEEEEDLIDVQGFDEVNTRALSMVNTILTRDPSPSDSPNISRTHSRQVSGEGVGLR